MSIRSRRAMRRAVGIAATFTVILGAGSGTAQASGCVTAACANAHQPLYFVHGDPVTGAHVRVFRMNDDGSAVTPLTGDISAYNSVPDISVDRSRTKLAILGRGSVSTVSIGNIDGTGQHVVASSVAYTGISLSPDGSQVAIADSNLVEIPTPLGPHVLFANTAGPVITVAWSPDGRRIAFDAAGVGGPIVWVVNADGTNPVRLTVGREPAWSPDGTHVAYAFGETPGQLRTVPVTPNPTPTVVAAFSTRVGWPSWSPDGSWIAYEMWRPDQHVDIRKVHVNGTADTELAQDGFQITWGYPAATPINPLVPGP